MSLKKNLLMLSSAIITYTLTYSVHAEILFSCRTMNGKNLKIERAHENLIYSLSGRTGNNEMRIENKISSSNIIIGNNSDGYI